MLLGKKNSMDFGYVYAPYIMMTTSSQIIERKSVNDIRKSKISKIFNLDYNDTDNSLFNPSKSIKSRYSTKIINSNLYGYIK